MVREDIVKAIAEVQTITNEFTNIGEELDVQKLGIMFMDIIEDLDVVQEKKLSAETVNLYNQLLEEIYQQEDQGVKKIQEEKMEETISNETVENVKFLNGIFAMWKEKGFAEIELPEEVSLKDMEKIFLKTLEEMPFDDKLKGGYTKEIDQYLMKLTQKKAKRGTRKSNAVEDEAEKKYIESIKDLLDSLRPNYIAEKIVYEEKASKNDIEKLFLSEILTTLSENDFCEIMQDGDFARNLRNMAVARKLQEINVKGKRGSRKARPFKKWDGEGEPFQEKSMGGVPSVQYFVYNAAKTGKMKFADLEKKLNQEFGETPKGPRSLQKVIDKVNKKISDHQTISIEKEKVVIK